MRVISIKKFKDFWSKPEYKDSEHSLKAWYSEAKKADCKTPDDMKKQYRNASILPNNRIVFNIKSNDYRLIVAIKYEFQIVYIRFIGTHKQYDTINAEVI